MSDTDKRDAMIARCYSRVPPLVASKGRDNIERLTNDECIAKIKRAWRAVGHDIDAFVSMTPSRRIVSNLVSGLPRPVWERLMQAWLDWERREAERRQQAAELRVRRGP